MALDRRLLLSHCAVHALSFAAGLLVVVPMALNGSAFKGRCALFSTGYWRTEEQPALPAEQPREFSHLVVQQWGPLAACQFVTFVGIFTVLYGAAQGWRCLFYLTLFSSFLTVLLSVCVLFLSGGASVILFLGFSTWCDTVTDTHRRPYSCAESQSVPLYLDVNTLSFYTELNPAAPIRLFLTFKKLKHNIRIVELNKMYFLCQSQDAIDCLNTQIGCLYFKV
uniref:Zgc:153018 n=1 Tax=Oryzias sinensis TaxID=183150 RepID=A0A8C7XSG9_9TELE